MIKTCNAALGLSLRPAPRWVRAVAFLWLTGLVGVSQTAHGDVPTSSLTTWLQESRLPSVVQNAFRARLTTDPQAQEWLVAQDGQIYALTYQPYAATAHAQIQQARRRVAEMKARQLLLLYAAGAYYQQQGFSNREATAKALTTVDTTTYGRLLPGLSSRAATLDDGAVALVWTGEDHVASYRQQPPPLDQFRSAYCHALYPTAKALFLEHRYHDALPIYLDMHNLRCHQPTAYFLDAAESFLAIQKPEDARRMTDYLLAEYAGSLDSQEVERAGDILLDAGDEEKARKAYELALSKLRAGH